MARKLETFDFGRFNWDEFLDGSIWELTLQDMHQFQTIQHFRHLAYEAARRRHRSLRTKVVGDRIIIQALKKEV